MQIAVSRSIQPLERQCIILVKSIRVIVSNLLNCSLCEAYSGQFREQTQALFQWPVFAVFTLCSVFAIKKRHDKRNDGAFSLPPVMTSRCLAHFSQRQLGVRAKSQPTG